MKILALVESPDHVCCRYRLRAFEPALRAAGCDLTIEALSSSLMRRVAQLRSTSGYDVTLLQRKLLSGWQWRLLRRGARRLLFDFDDAVLFRDSYDRRGSNCSRRAARFRRIVRETDLSLAGNAYLAELARNFGAPSNQVFEMPTCVDPARYPVCEQVEDRGSLDLVWVGSSSTLRGLERSRELWSGLGGVMPSLRLRLICDRFATFDPLPVVGVAWSPAKEPQQIAAGHVGIAWMPDDEWSRGKCGLKVLQYQAAGLPVVANRVGIHARLVEPDRTGHLADSEAEWLEALHDMESASRRASMGCAARAFVDSRYSVRAWADRFVQAVVGGAMRPGLTRADSANPSVGRHSRQDQDETAQIGSSALELVSARTRTDQASQI